MQTSRLRNCRGASARIKTRTKDQPLVLLYLLPPHQGEGLFTQAGGALPAALDLIVADVCTGLLGQSRQTRYSLGMLVQDIVLSFIPIP